MIKQIILFLTVFPLFLWATPNAPSDLELKALSETSVSVKWKDNSSDETGFKIYRDDVLIMITDAGVTSYIDEGLSPNTTYTYIVKSTDDGFNVALENLTVGYNSFTLEASGDYSAITIENNSQTYPYKLSAIKNGEKFMLFNIPLISGDNELNVTIADLDGKSSSTLYHVQLEVDASTYGRVPIGLQVEKFSDITELHTSLIVHTSFEVSEYMLDIEGDGVIDSVSSDGNFTIDLAQEGRYKPKVTVRTTSGELYTTEHYALSLDVKASTDQKDPSGATPLAVAKRFVKAIIEDDSEVVGEILGHKSQYMKFIYEDAERLQMAKERYRHIQADSWQERYFNDKNAKVTMRIVIDGVERPAGFEFSIAGTQIYTGRYWVMKLFY